MFIGSLIVLGVVVALTLVALFSGHIPGLREWTGAAPLQAEEPDTAHCYPKSVTDGFEPPVTWDPPPVYPRHPEIPKEGS